MRSGRVGFLPGAHRDIEDAMRWYGAERPGAERDFEQEVMRAIALIAERPNAWPPLGDRARHFVMQKLPYSVVYVIVDDSIIVVAVAHGNRRPDYWYERLSEI